MLWERLRAKARENAGFLKICLALVILEVVIIVPMWAAGAHGDRNIWLFFSIPLISGLVGYTTNVLALIMTFAPLEFTGIPVLLIPNEPVGLFGWQGIIPAKAGKMAAISVDLMLEKLFDVREIFEKLDPQRVSALLEPGLMEITKRVVDTVAMEHAPALWREMPPPLKAEVLRTSRDAAPAMIHGMLDEMKDRILEVLDVRTMAIRHLELHKELLIDMFQKCGKEEFIFIEQSGFYFGFSFGLLQMVIYAFYDATWVLPTFGFVVGYATNAIALKMIFSPIEPTPLGPWVVQGLFLKRQQQVSEIFAKNCAENIMTSRLMWDEMLRGPNVHKFEAIVRRHAGLLVDSVAGSARPMLQAFLKFRGGGWSFERVKDRVADIVVLELPGQIALIHDYTEEALDLETEVRTKMSALPSAEFEAVLHPVFEEDEIKLILVGAVLGVLVGCFQEFVMFAQIAG